MVRQYHYRHSNETVATGSFPTFAVVRLRTLNVLANPPVVDVSRAMLSPSRQLDQPCNRVSNAKRSCCTSS